MESQIEIYKSLDNQVELQVQFDGETAWLSQGQMAELFVQTKQNISLHINNCFKEGELEQDSLDVIISLIVKKSRLCGLVSSALPPRVSCCSTVCAPPERTWPSAMKRWPI